MDRFFACSSDGGIHSGYSDAPFSDTDIVTAKKKKIQHLLIISFFFSLF